MVTNIVKEEFKEIESLDGGSLNLIVMQDTQSSRKRLYWAGRDFSLDFQFQRCLFSIDTGHPIYDELAPDHNPVKKLRTFIPSTRVSYPPS